MATQAHCAYCFETLSASLEKRQPLQLREIELLWEQYYADPDAPADDASDADDNPAAPATDSSRYRAAGVTRLRASSPSTGSSSSVQSASSTPSKNSSRSSILSLGKRLKGAEKDQAETEGSSPLFVTWNTTPRSGEKRLRGCIGTFEAQELDDGLRSYALTSALEDTRFAPISLRELPSLECGVTLLTDFEAIASPLDWTVGTHGLRISFTVHGRRYGSTYLPDVAKEQGWSKEETMVSLMRKAGWSGRSSEWERVGLSVVRYQGAQVRLGFEEWRTWREWVDEEEVEEEEEE